MISISQEEPLLPFTISNHCESDDLDLFTDDAASLAPTAREFENQLQTAGLNMRVKKATYFYKTID